MASNVLVSFLKGTMSRCGPGVIFGVHHLAFTIGWAAADAKLAVDIATKRVVLLARHQTGETIGRSP